MGAIGGTHVVGGGGGKVADGGTIGAGATSTTGDAVGMGAIGGTHVEGGGGAKVADGVTRCDGGVDNSITDGVAVGVAGGTGKKDEYTFSCLVINSTPHFFLLTRKSNDRRRWGYRCRRQRRRCRQW